MIFESSNHFKSVFAHQFFIRAADHNYVVARWARIVGLTREFFIQAHQAVEKYLKAALVLNGLPVLKYRHDIVLLFRKHLEVFGDLAVVNLEKPDKLDSELWKMPSAFRFIQHLESNGNPDSRYRLTSFAAYSSDLFHLDELVRRLRRLTIGLDWAVGQDWAVSDELTDCKGVTYRQALMRHPRAQIRGEILDESELARKLSPSLNDALLLGNVAFYESLEPEHLRIPGTVASWLGPLENSYLFLLAEALRDGRVNQVVRDGTLWIIDNILLPPPVRDELRRLALPS